MALSPQEQAELDRLELEALENEKAQLEAQGKYESPVIQEQHPDIGFGTRALVKNLSQSEDVTRKYLEGKGFQTNIIDGQLVVKKPGEAKYKVLDPSGFDLQDITDVGYDIGSGVATGAATAGGAALGAGAAGVGAIPGAAAAGGASSAGLEALRQKLGAWMGLPQEVSGTDIAVSGAVGAVAPKVFGVGGSKGLLQEGYEATKSALPKVGQYFSNVPAKATEIYAKNPKAIEMMKPEGATSELANATYDKLKSSLQAVKQNVGESLGQEIDTAQKPVNIAKVRAHLDNFITKLETGPTSKNPQVQAQIEQFKAARDGVFKHYVTPQLDVPPDYENLKKLVGALSDAEKSSMAAQNPQVAQVLRLMQQEKTGVTLEPKLMDLPPEIEARHAFELQDLLKDTAEFRNPASGLGSRFGKDMTSQEKQFAEAANNAYQELNSELNSVTAGASQKLKNQYRAYSELQKQLGNRFKDPTATEKTLSNLYNPSNKMIKEGLDELKKLSGGQVDVTREAEQMFASKFYSNPSMMPVSGSGVTSTSRSVPLGALGGYMGYKAAGAPGAMAGLAAGGYLGSPSAMKNAYIPMAKGTGYLLEKGASLARPIANPAGATSTWNLMKNRGR